MSDNHLISAENLGPIDHFEFRPKGHGVTILVAPNGSGKSILLEAVQAAARGEGKLPLRDRTRKGKVEAFGAVITIGGTCRHTGAFEVTNLEGKFDLSQLVDPRLKSPAAADKARIKALVNLTNVGASADLFRKHEAFENFDEVVTAEALATDDLVEMAAKIKACYDDEALKCERLADRKYGQANAMVPASDIDLDEECDADVLQAAYNEARDRVTRLAEQARNAAASNEQLAKAKKVLDDLGDDELKKERSQLSDWLETVDFEIDERNTEIQELLTRAEKLRGEIKGIQSRAIDSREKITSIDRTLARVEEAKKTVANSKSLVAPEQSDIDEAKEELASAAAAIEVGVKVRAAKENAKKVTQYRAEAKEEQDKALRYRDAGKATDEVLSGCIKCPQLRVESDGKSARLVTDTEKRGKSIAFHELSDGEKWTIAIDIGADQVGVDGLLVINQQGWEGIDGKHRPIIDRQAKLRKVFVLTAEKSLDENASDEIVPIQFGETVPPKPVEHKEEPKPAEPVKPAAKPATKPKSKPAPEPVDNETPPF